MVVLLVSVSDRRVGGGGGGESGEVGGRLRRVIFVVALTLVLVRHLAG